LNIRPRTSFNKYARFSALAIQMGVIIGLFTWGGTEMDKAWRYGKFPLFTTILSLSGVAVALYLVLREVIRMGKEEEERDKQKKSDNA
jgi:hypothetical protein